MRDFSADRNVIEIQDGISGDIHEIYYRLPTNEERASYQSNLISRRGKKIQTRIFETRIKFGGKLVTGFRKGTLGIEGKAFASDSTDPDYREDWKELLLKFAPDVIASVAVTAFEATGVQREPEDDVPLDE
jgi:hypothetical protein